MRTLERLNLILNGALVTPKPDEILRNEILHRRLKPLPPWRPRRLRRRWVRLRISAIQYPTKAQAMGRVPLKFLGDDCRCKRRGGCWVFSRPVNRQTKGD